MWTPAQLHVTINMWIWWNMGHWGSNLEMQTWDPYNGRALARQLWNRGQLQTRTAMKELWDSCRTEHRSDLQWDWTPDLFGTSPCTLRGSTPIPQCVLPFVPQCVFHGFCLVNKKNTNFNVFIDSMGIVFCIANEAFLTSGGCHSGLNAKLEYATPATMINSSEQWSPQDGKYQTYLKIK